MISPPNFLRDCPSPFNKMSSLSLLQTYIQSTNKCTRQWKITRNTQKQRGINKTRKHMKLEAMMCMQKKIQKSNTRQKKSFKTTLSHFVLAIYCVGPTCIWFICTMWLHWRKLNFSLQVVVVSRIGCCWGIWACVHFPLTFWTFSVLNLYRPCAFCHKLWTTILINHVVLGDNGLPWLM